MGAIVPIAVAGYSIYQGYSQSKEAKEASDKAERLRREEYARQERMAGEYYDLSKKQMELQAQGQNIQTLATLIDRTRQPAEPNVFYMPPAKTYSPWERINKAIYEVLRA